MTSPWESEYRISQETLPLNYDLYLFPDLETDTFTGRVTISIDSKVARHYFVVHIKNLTISLSELKDANGHAIEIQDAFAYEPNEFWVVTTKRELPPGNYSLRFEFKGRLDNGIVGFYK